MGFKPRTQDDIYTSLRDTLKGKIPGLTNFTDTSFNWVWTQGFSAEFREKELDKTAVYLSGLVDYAGGPVTEDDLEKLGIDDVTSPVQLNDRLNDIDLDELVKIVGVERDPGTKATGTVTVTTQSADTPIPKGERFGTQPDNSGDFLEFETNEKVTAGPGTTEVDVDIIATEVGTGYNVGSGTITYLPDPSVGVQGVTNNQATTGGEDEESNDELRKRAKQAIFRSSGGGTVAGLKGYVERELDGVTEVNVEEFFTGDMWHGNYPHGHVIIAGNVNAEDALDVINEARPVSVEHFFVEPNVYNIATNIELTGEDIQTGKISDPSEPDKGAIPEYLDDLELGDEMVYNRLIQLILNADEDIFDVETLDLSVDGEPLYFNEEIIDDFEDANKLIENANWNDWDGDTAAGNFDIQTSTTISGSYTANLSSTNQALKVKTYQDYDSGARVPRGIEVKLQIDNQTGDAADTVEVGVDNVNDKARLEFRGDGSIVAVGDSSSTFTATWSAGELLTVTIQELDDLDRFELAVKGEEQEVPAIGGDTTWNDVFVVNDTDSSGSTVNAYFDDVKGMQTKYPLGLGSETVSDGITEVVGTAGGQQTTFQEDTDYREYRTGINSSDNGTLEWIMSGTRPDLNDGNTKSRTFDTDRDVYFIDEQMVEDGITEVKDSSGTTYTEGTDWEETDTNNDDRNDAIEWLGNSQPTDKAEFTVTYISSTTTKVDYDITDDDVNLDEDEQINAGPVTVTVL